MNELGNYLCDVCINIMQAASDASGLSYGLINILFFVILQPLAILSFMISTFMYIAYYNTEKCIYKTLSRIFVILGFICIFAVLFPILYTIIFIPWWLCGRILCWFCHSYWIWHKRHSLDLARWCKEYMQKKFTTVPNLWIQTHIWQSRGFFL